MDSGKTSIWLQIAANLGLLAGLVFVALEIRTNTETNLISIFQASSANWMEINGDLMERDVAELLEKAFSDEEIDGVERRQFEGWIRQQLTHAAFIRRLHNAELISDAKFRNEMGNGIREYRKSDRFRQRINSLVKDEEFRKLILDDGGLDSWLGSGPTTIRAQSASSEPYVIGWNEGEILFDSQGRTTSITVSPDTDATDLAFWTTELPAGSDILLHRHDRTEEILFVHRGSGTLVVDDEEIAVEEGATIHVPPGTYHGMAPQENDMTIVFVATPPHLVNFFRELGWHEGEEPPAFTPDEIQILEQRYDSIAAPQ